MEQLLAFSSRKQRILSPIGPFSSCNRSRKLHFLYVRRLRTVLAFGDFKFNLVAFLQTLVSLSRDGAEVNKNVWAIFSSDEPVSFCVIEPLYRALHALLAGIQSPRILCLRTRQKPYGITMLLRAIWMGCFG